MNVNEKGVRGLIKVIDDLQDKGYYCFTPFDDHSPIDLIVVDKTGRTYRLQIKCRSSANRLVQASSVVNGKRVPINRDMIDGWAVYIADLDKIIYFSKAFLGDRATHTVDVHKDYGALSSWDAALPC